MSESDASTSDASKSGWPASLFRSWLPSRSSAILFLLGVPSVFFLQVSVHELSHCALASLSAGDECLWVAPFPIAVEGVDGGFGMGATFTAADVAAPGVFASASIVAFVLIFVLRVLLTHTRDRRLALLARVWLFGVAIDFFANSIAGVRGAEGTDWAWLAKIEGWSPSQLLTLAVPLWCVALGALLVPIGGPSARELEKAWPRRDVAGVAAVYWSVSLVAIATSVGVVWPEIARQAKLYWIALALQGATLTWTTWFVARYWIGPAAPAGR